MSRLDYLEKMLGSKKSIEDDSSNKDKLPLIKRPKRDRDNSMYEKSSAKKDMAEVKNELMNWLNNYLANSKSKDNI